jgi:hypothetical protein
MYLTINKPLFVLTKQEQNGEYFGQKLSDEQISGKFNHVLCD